MFGDLTCGVDLLLIERFESVLNRHPDRFPRRILTDREREYCGDRLAEMAVRFAGKEAVMKCLGTGVRGVKWKEIEILANASRSLADSTIAGFVVNTDNINAALDRNPILVTALNPVIGYEKGAAIAKQAYQEGRPIKDVAREMTDLSDEELDRLLDPAALTEGGIQH